MADFFDDFDNIENNIGESSTNPFDSFNSFDLFEQADESYVKEYDEKDVKKTKLAMILFIVGFSIELFFMTFKPIFYRFGWVDNLYSVQTINIPEFIMGILLITAMMIYSITSCNGKEKSFLILYSIFCFVLLISNIMPKAEIINKCDIAYNYTGRIIISVFVVCCGFMAIIGAFVASNESDNGGMYKAIGLGFLITSILQLIAGITLNDKFSYASSVILQCFMSFAKLLILLIITKDYEQGCEYLAGNFESDKDNTSNKTVNEENSFNNDKSTEFFAETSGNADAGKQVNNNIENNSLNENTNDDLFVSKDVQQNDDLFSSTTSASESDNLIKSNDVSGNDDLFSSTKVASENDNLFKSNDVVESDNLFSSTKVASNNDNLFESGDKDFLAGNKTTTPPTSQAQNRVMPVAPRQMSNEARPVAPKQMPNEARPVAPKQMPNGVRPVAPRQIPNGVRPVAPRQMPNGARPVAPRQMPNGARPVAPRQMPNGARPANQNRQIRPNGKDKTL